MLLNFKIIRASILQDTIKSDILDRIKNEQGHCRFIACCSSNFSAGFKYHEIKR